MENFKKRFQLWIRAEGSQFTFEEFDTLEELIKAPKYSDWYVTQRVNLKIIDLPEDDRAEKLGEALVEISRIQNE